jgi:hypothetical protein
MAGHAPKVVCATLLFAACGAEPGADPDLEPSGPKPWTSGSIVYAQVFQGDGLRALAGRADDELSFSCPVDDRNAPAFANCPRKMSMYYRDSACTIRDLAIDPALFSFEKYARGVAPDDGVGLGLFAVGSEAWGGRAYDRIDGVCREATFSYREHRATTPIDPSALRLGTTVAHEYGGVRYETVETDDGFSVITHVEGGTPVIESSGGRVKARYVVNQDVRMYAGLYDRGLDAPCMAAEGKDGVLRCVSTENAVLGTATIDPNNCWYGIDSVIYARTPGTTVDLTPTASRPRFTRVLNCIEPATLWTRGGAGSCFASEGYICSDLPADYYAPLQLAAE